MLFENFLGSIASTSEEAINADNFTMMDLKQMDDMIVPYKLVPLEKLKYTGELYYTEREISLEEFRQESTLALVMKFTEDILVAELNLDENAAMDIVKTISVEVVKSDYDNIFEAYIPYNELIVANKTTKEFGLLDDSTLSDAFYSSVFENLSEIFINVLENKGYYTNKQICNVEPNQNLPIS